MNTQKVRIQVLDAETNEVIDECDIITSSDAVLFSDGKSLTTKVNDLIKSINTPLNPKILTNENLNDVIDTGEYIQTANDNALVSERNYPVALAGKLTVSKANDAFVFQTYQEYNDSTLWLRCRYLSKWYSWNLPYDRVAYEHSMTNLFVNDTLTVNKIRFSYPIDTGGTRERDMINIPCASTYGAVMDIAPGQSLILHGGDRNTEMIDEIGVAPENLYLTADNHIIFHTNIQAGNNAKTIARLDKNGEFYLGGDATKIAYHAGNLTKTTVNAIIAGSDYAEMFQWKDPDVYVKGQYGKFVTLNGDKIELASHSSEYVLGVVSSLESASIIGDPSHIGEFGWDPIGIMGKLNVVDDGTCVVNKYCKPLINGIATHSEEETNYRVMERINKNQIRVMIK